jgi:hypothetical protein
VIAEGADGQRRLDVIANAAASDGFRVEGEHAGERGYERRSFQRQRRDSVRKLVHFDGPPAMTEPCDGSITGGACSPASLCLMRVGDFPFPATRRAAFIGDRDAKKMS